MDPDTSFGRRKNSKCHPPPSNVIPNIIPLPFYPGTLQKRIKPRHANLAHAYVTLKWIQVLLPISRPPITQHNNIESRPSLITASLHIVLHTHTALQCVDMTSQKAPEWWWKQNYQADSLTRMLQGEQKRSQRNQQTDTETIQARKAVVEKLISLQPEDELLFLVVELLDRYLQSTKSTQKEFVPKIAAAVAYSLGCKFLRNEDEKCEEELAFNVFQHLLPAQTFESWKANIRKLELHFLQTVGWLVPSTTLYHFVAILLAVSNSSSKLAEKTWQCARISLVLPSTCSYASTVAAECFQQSVATEQSVAECSNLPELWLKWAKGKDNHHANSKKRKLNEL